MDVIDRFERSRAWSRFSRVTLVAAILLVLSIQLWRESRLLEQIEQLARQGRQIEARAKHAEELLQEILGRPPGASSARAVRAYSWTAARAFVQGKHDECIVGSSPGTKVDQCDWGWKLLAGAQGNPDQVIHDALQAHRSVVIVASVGHDDLALSPAAKARYGTNFGLASLRATTLLQAIVHRANGGTCDDDSSQINCLAIAQGAHSRSSEEWEHDRKPRLTVIVAG